MLPYNDPHSAYGRGMQPGGYSNPYPPYGPGMQTGGYSNPYPPYGRDIQTGGYSNPPYESGMELERYLDIRRRAWRIFFILCIGMSSFALFTILYSVFGPDNPAKIYIIIIPNALFFITLLIFSCKQSCRARRAIARNSPLSNS